MKTSWSLAVAASVAACGVTGPSVEGTCIAVVNVDGVWYSDVPPLAEQPPVVPEPYLEITRNTGCLDQGEVADPLSHGESNFLEVGTKLHRLEGIPAAERLVHWSPVVSEWLELGPRASAESAR